MSHTVKHKAKLLARVRRLKGQIEAVVWSLEAEALCGESLKPGRFCRRADGGS